jgi:hypothetical protein
MPQSMLAMTFSLPTAADEPAAFRVPENAFPLTRPSYCAPPATYCRLSPEYLAGRFNTAANLWPVVEGHYAPEGYLASFGLVFAMQVAVWLWSASGRGVTRT